MEPATRPPRILSCRILTLLVALLALQGCSDRGGTLIGVREPDPQIREYLTDGASSTLRPDGTFPMAAPIVPLQEPVISRDEAVAQAHAWLRAFGPLFAHAWARDRGEDLRIGDLSTQRVYFAESPYGRFPAGPFHPGYRKIFGPYYLVVLGDERGPVLILSVSALNHDVRVDERGLIRTPADGGNEVEPYAVPKDLSQFPIRTPERAVEHVARATGARITTPPLLHLMHSHRAPILALWQIQLDRPARLREIAGGRSRSAQTVYLNSRGEYFLPQDVQPESQAEVFLVGPPWDPRDGQRVSATVPIRPGRAVEWARADLEVQQ
jgi:hypothetical protein